MLRMVLLGFLILFGVGVLSAMELRTPPRNAVAIVQPLNEANVDISDSHDALAKADRLEVAAVSREPPERAVLIDEGIARPEDISIGSSEPPPIARHWHNPKSKKVTTAARPSWGQRQPLSSEPQFPSVQRPPAIPSPVGSRRLVACVRL